MDVENMLQVRARRGDMSLGPDTIKVYCFQKNRDRRCAAQRLELVEVPQSVFIEPFLTLETCAAQKLMDDLWDCGLRPSEGTGSAGAMAAAQKHLQDMKTIAYHVLKIK
jgi:hypothetical protein